MNHTDHEFEALAAIYADAVLAKDPGRLAQRPSAQHFVAGMAGLGGGMTLITSRETSSVRESRLVSSAHA